MPSSTPPPPITSLIAFIFFVVATPLWCFSPCLGIPFSVAGIVCGVLGWQAAPDNTWARAGLWSHVVLIGVWVGLSIIGVSLYLAGVLR